MWRFDGNGFNMKIEREVQKSKDISIITVFIILIGLGIVFFCSAFGGQHLASDDFIKVEVNFDRITVGRGESIQHTIFCTSGRRYVIGSSTSHLFGAEAFAANIKKGDLIVLTVLARDYEQKDFVSTLAVDANGENYMDFERALERYKSNARGMIILACAMVATGFSFLFVYLFAKIRKKEKSMANT